MTYSVEFRKKVLSIKAQENLSFDEVANRVGVGKSTVVRWSKRLEPQRTRHQSATKLDLARLARERELRPDAYQYELAQLWGVSQTGIGNALKRLGISRKKPFSPVKADINARQTFQTKITRSRQAHRPVVSLDESGFAQDMPRQ
ncbi:transposase [Thioploca ingrica]|uniref:Transposase n=1 Tax=Thioploca ingrica TaxID=40754 RepID=A0A090AI24_9GAMM|nr:transposase [Thioploca ingrica]